MPNLRDISIPMDEANESLNKKLKLEIEEGRIEIGELIVPQSYDKVVISNGQVSTEEVEIEGWKIPFESIRKKLLKEQKDYMRLREDSEYELLQRDHVVEDSEYELLQRDHVVDSLKNINEFTEKDNVLYMF